MQVLTPSGYKDITTLSVGDEVCAYDIETGVPIINRIELIEPVNYAEWCRWWQVEPTVPPFNWYRINGTWTLFREQSIWTSPLTVKHVRDLVVGDTIYDDHDNALTIASIAPVEQPLWYRLEIDGDHSFIADGLTLHNASRFWVGGTGTWDLSATTHWSASTGGASGSSAPGSADTVTLDGSSGGGTVTPSYGGTGTFQSITCGAFTGTIAWNTNNNSVTTSSGTGFNFSGSGTRTISIGNGTFTNTNTSGNSTPWNLTTTTGLTFNANSSTITFTGPANAAAFTFAGGGQTYNVVTLAGSIGGVWTVSGANTFATLNLTAPVYIQFAGSATQTITNAFS